MSSLYDKGIFLLCRNLTEQVVSFFAFIRKTASGNEDRTYVPLLSSERPNLGAIRVGHTCQVSTLRECGLLSGYEMQEVGAIGL